MSIKVGFRKEKYSYQELNNHNAFKVNSYTSDDVITLNGDMFAWSNVLINHGNKIQTGVLSSNNTSDTYIIKDLKQGSNLMSLNNENIVIAKKTHFHEDVYIKHIFSTSNNTTNLHGNLQLSLGDSNNIDDVFEIYSKSNKRIFKIDSSNLNIDNNVYIQNGTLYVSSISSIGNNALQIENAQYSSSIVESMTINENLNIFNISKDIPSISVSKIIGQTDILNISSMTVDNQIIPDMILNKNGLLGLGTSEPDATLSLRNTSTNNIISYYGTNNTEVIMMTKEGNFGIGTNNPSGQLHIKRNSDNTLNNLREYPLLHMDMDYDTNFNTKNEIVSKKSRISDEDNETPIFYPQEVGTNNYNMFLIPSGLEEVIDNLINKDISVIEVLYPNKIEDLNSFDFKGPDDNDISLTINFVFPNNNYNILSTTITYGGTVDKTMPDGTLVKVYKLNSTIIIQNNEGEFNSISEIEFDSLTLTTVINDELQNTFNLEFISLLKLDFSITNFSWEFDYKKIEETILPPPKFIEFTSNNQFVSSISDTGTLSFGSDVPLNKKNDYDIYAPNSSKSSLIATLNTENLITENERNEINFNNTNIINIGSLSNIDTNCSTLKTQILTCTNNATFSNITTSNFTCQNIDNDRFKYSFHETQITNKLSIGTSSPEKTNSMCEIQVGVNIDTSTKFAKKNGLVVTNKSDDNDINPAILIQSINNKDIPYLELSNGYKSAYFRIKKESDDKNFLQLTSGWTDINSLTVYNEDTPMCVLNYLMDSNMLAIGGNALCIKYTSMTDYKITIGLPSGLVVTNDNDEKNYISDEFQTIIDDTNNEYNVNVFGNVLFATKDNKTMLSVMENQIDSNKACVSINCPRDNSYALKVDGKTFFDSISVRNDFEDFMDGGIQYYKDGPMPLSIYIRYIVNKL